VTTVPGDPEAGDIVNVVIAAAPARPPDAQPAATRSAASAGSRPGRVRVVITMYLRTDP
jgi:hypothetical protein